MAARYTGPINIHLCSQSFFLCLLSPLRLGLLTLRPHYCYSLVMVCYFFHLFLFNFFSFHHQIFSCFSLIMILLMFYFFVLVLPFSYFSLFPLSLFRYLYLVYVFFSSYNQFVSTLLITVFNPTSRFLFPFLLSSF